MRVRPRSSPVSCQFLVPQVCYHFPTSSQTISGIPPRSWGGGGENDSTPPSNRTYGVNERQYAVSGACMYVCIVHVHTSTQSTLQHKDIQLETYENLPNVHNTTNKLPLYVCMYVCMHVCMYACIYICMYIHMHACTQQS